jgi:hypothetical protein
MAGSVSRLIAVVAGVTFIVTQCYGTSHGSQTFPVCTCQHTSHDQDVEESEPCESGCHSTHEHATQQVVASESPPCPCHGSGLPAPCGPCPDGCAFCSMAKVPCLLPVGLPLTTIPTPGDGVVEVTHSYTSPFSGTLTRPPRF